MRHGKEMPLAAQPRRARGMAGKIFINYRREDARADARTIRDRLAGAFGASRVFMDVDNLQPGQRFDQELAKALAQCDVFLSVIGPRWQALLEERARTAARDYVREEIAAALQRGIAVIPVLIERTPLPPPDGLPPDIRALVMHQKHGVEHERFGRDVDELIAAIRAITGVRRGTGPWRRIAMGVGVIALLVVFGPALVVPFILRPARFDEAGSTAGKPAASASLASADKRAAAAAKADAEAQAKRREEEELRRKADEAERQRRRVAALEAQKTQRDPIPADLPVDAQVLRAIETNPLFAHAPPIAAKTYRTAQTSSLEGGRDRTTSTTDARVHPLRPGLSRFDTTNTFANGDGSPARNTSSGLVAGNGLLEVAGKSSGSITKITALAAKGRIFPVAVGNRFSLTASYQVEDDGSLGGGTTSVSTTKSCSVSKKYDAASFHPELTGTAYLALCDTESVAGTGSLFSSSYKHTSKGVTVFFEELGLWIDADRTSPKETFLRKSHAEYGSNSGGFLYATSVLKSFSLLP
jgi:hypothetical protein